MPPHDKHDKHHHKADKAAKHAVDIGVRLTVAAIDAGVLTAASTPTPEQIADFFLAVTRRIIDAPIDGDGDTE